MQNDDGVADTGRVNAPELRYTTSGDVGIAYATVGDGPFDLVFVGGWVLSMFEAAWDGPAADTLGRLGSFARVLHFDKRGTGLSDRVTTLPTLEQRMDDVRAVMAAALGALLLACTPSPRSRGGYFTARLFFSDPP